MGHSFRIYTIFCPWPFFFSSHSKRLIAKGEEMWSIIFILMFIPWDKHDAINSPITNQNTDQCHLKTNHFLQLYLVMFQIYSQQCELHVNSTCIFVSPFFLWLKWRGPWMYMFYTFETVVCSTMLRSNCLQNYVKLENHRLILPKMQQSP